MKTEDIIRDIREIIYDTDRIWNTVSQSKTSAFRDDDLEEALLGLDQARDGLSLIEEMLNTLIYNIEMEALSHKVQNKTKTLVELFDEEEAKK